MKLIHGDIGISLDFKENTPICIVLENRKLFTEALYELVIQTNGGEGNWILSEGEKVLSLSRNMEIIFNPLAININDKKILTKLYHDINESIIDNYILDITELNAEIISFLEKVFNSLPFSIATDYEIDYTSLLKMYNTRFDYEVTSLLERIITYIKIMHQVCKTNVFTFVGLKNYLTEEELCELYKAASYEKVYLLLFEGVERPLLSAEERIIIDKDLCKILICQSEV